MKNKVLLIGWDAADWRLIHPLIRQGSMPNLAKLMQEGVSGNLMTLDPPLSPMLWTSIATGKYPHKHGVLGFVEPNPRSTNIRPIHVTSRKVKAIWNILMQRSYKVHQVGWWPSHPAEPINGISVSNFYQRSNNPIEEHWSILEKTIHPKEKEDIFAALRVHPDELTWTHLQPFIPNGYEVNQEDERTHQLLLSLRKIIAACSTIHSAATYIMEQEDWDFMAVYQDAIDHFGHGFMKYHPPQQSHIPKELYDIFYNVITAAYRYHDMMLGQLMELAGEEATVVLVSDHGFHPDHLRVKDIPKDPAGPSWEHAPYGIFAMKGPNVRQNVTIEGASLIDITPTILAHLGESVALDMDGKVLTPIFQKIPNLKTINSWEGVDGDCGMHTEDKLEDMASNQAALDQLIELGYVAELSSNMKENIQLAFDEQNFYKALFYVDEGKYTKAIPILRRLYEQHPTKRFYGHRLALCYLETKQTALASDIVHNLQTQQEGTSATLLKLQASLATQEGAFEKALDYILQAISTKAKYPGLQRHLGKAYKNIHDLENAKIAFETAIQYDPKDYQAHHYLGQLFLEKDQPILATENLLTSINLRYFNPKAHFDLGKSLLELKKYESAAQAFQVALHMMPSLIEAKKQLVNIYTHHLAQPERTVSLLKELPDETLPEIIIVSGLPRSGTSMMMQMLDKGGLSMFTDGEREADSNNPKGYYEHEAVKSLAQNSSFLVDAEDKVVKIIAQLLFHLPTDYRYKIIFMERDIGEVLQSQHQMLLRLGKTRQTTYSFKVWKNFHDTIDKVKKTLKKHPNIDFLFVQHSNTIKKPEYIAKRIQQFLNRPMDTTKMTNVVDKRLHRERVEEHVGT